MILPDTDAKRALEAIVQRQLYPARRKVLRSNDVGAELRIVDVGIVHKECRMIQQVERFAAKFDVVPFPEFHPLLDPKIDVVGRRAVEGPEPKVPEGIACRRLKDLAGESIDADAGSIGRIDS